MKTLNTLLRLLRMDYENMQLPMYKPLYLFSDLYQ